MTRFTRLTALVVPGLLLASNAWAAPVVGTPTVVDAAKTATGSSVIQLVVMMALASLAPAIILTCTTFARFAIVFSFLKSGLGTQGAPPSQIMAGLAMFMTFFVMSPVANRIHAEVAKPYFAGQIDEEKALEAATPILQGFLLPRTRQDDLALFYQFTDLARPTQASEVPLRIAIPAFVVSELRTAFQMGLVILLPFLVIDLAVAIVLSSLGMVMLPPVFVSLPIKILVFVTADGWHLLVSSLLKGAMSS
jgi:flagellar biosynthesis protein FliP